MDQNNVSACVCLCRFGWLGLNKDVPPHIIMNYIGVVLCLIRYHLYFCVYVPVCYIIFDCFCIMLCNTRQNGNNTTPWNPEIQRHEPADWAVRSYRWCKGHSLPWKSLLDQESMMPSLCQCFYFSSVLLTLLFQQQEENPPCKCMLQQSKRFCGLM